MLSDKREKKNHPSNKGKATLPPPLPHLFPLLAPIAPSRGLFLAHQQFLSDLGKGRQLFHSRCAGDVRSPAFPPFFSPALGASLSDRLADDMPGWAEALGSTLPQGAAPDGVCSRS